MAPTLTRFVLFNQHHTHTNRVLNGGMSTIGERIQKARKARNMSGEELALAVGYKKQSAISNLENRGGGTGGTKLPEIARILRVPLLWLAEGPDEGDVPFLEPMASCGTVTQTTQATQASESQAAQYWQDASIAEAANLFKQLRTEQRLQAIKYMRALLSAPGTGTNQIELGERDSIPQSRAA